MLHVCCVVRSRRQESGQEAVRWLHGSRHSVVYGAVLCCGVLLCSVLCCDVRGERFLHFSTAHCWVLSGTCYVAVGAT